MEKQYLVIFGCISFYEKSNDGVDKAIVYRIDETKMINDESEAEKIIDEGIHDSYVIPELYKFPIEMVI